MFVPIKHNDQMNNFKMNPRSSINNNTFKSYIPSIINQKQCNNAFSIDLNKFSFLNGLTENHQKNINLNIMNIGNPKKPLFAQEYEQNLRENIMRQNQKLELLMLEKEMLNKTIKRIQEDIHMDKNRLTKYINENEPLQKMIFELGNQIEKRSWDDFQVNNANCSIFKEICPKNNILYLKSELSSCEISPNIFKSERNSVKQSHNPKLFYQNKLKSKRKIIKQKKEQKKKKSKKNEIKQEDLLNLSESEKPEKYVLTDSDEHFLLELPPVEKYQRTVRIQLSPDNSLSTLLTILRNIMYAEPVEQNVLNSLNEIEIEILKSFLIKKKIISDEDEMVLQHTFFNSYYKIKTERRREENLKHVFMMAIKFLKHQFKIKFTNFKLPSSAENKNKKDQIELAFYIHYFGSVAEEKQWPISRFYQPKVSGSTRKLSSFRMKSINQDYVSYVKLSNSFMNDFEKYLNDEFSFNGKKLGIWKDSQDMIEEKLISKINKWDDSIQEERNGLKKIINSLAGNIKCKMPWSRNEINIAIADVKKLFDLHEDVKDIGSTLFNEA
jgi:hypothetical protein